MTIKKIYKKRVKTELLILLLCLCMTGCGKKENKEKENNKIRVMAFESNQLREAVYWGNVIQGI